MTAHATAEAPTDGVRYDNPFADDLRRELRPGATVFTVLRHVARSGMSRDIDLYRIENNEPRWLSGKAAEVLGTRRDKNGAIRVSGCGMDMGFHLVYELSRRLYPEGFGCIGEGCPSNDHSNGDRNYTPHIDGAGADKAHWHSDGGYALVHRWI